VTRVAGGTAEIALEVVNADGERKIDGDATIVVG
jgi:hypothetical protein